MLIAYNKNYGGKNMAKSKSKLNLSTNNIIACAIYAIIGLLLVILRSGSLGILMTVVGALLIALGIIDIVKNKDLTRGIIEAVIGVAIIVCGWVIADIVLLIFGILLIIKGIMDLIKNYKNGIWAIVEAGIIIVIGILLVIAKWTLMDVICIIAGVIFIINAVLVLFGKTLIKAK